MNTVTTTPSTSRPPTWQINQQTTRQTGFSGRERALPARELVTLAERHAAAADRAGLEDARAEAELRAHDQAPDSLSAQIAGYIGLLAEDHEHALADEAQAWSRELHRTLDPADPAAVPTPRKAVDQGERS